MGKYFPDTSRHAKAQEFLELKQATMTVIELGLEVKALKEPLCHARRIPVRPGWQIRTEVWGAILSILYTLLHWDSH